MIERVYGRYYAVCDICGEESPEFDDFYDCKDWVKENWRYHWDKIAMNGKSSAIIAKG